MPTYSEKEFKDLDTRTKTQVLVKAEYIEKYDAMPDEKKAKLFDQLLKFGALELDEQPQ